MNANSTHVTCVCLWWSGTVMVRGQISHVTKWQNRRSKCDDWWAYLQAFINMMWLRLWMYIWNKMNSNKTKCLRWNGAAVSQSFDISSNFPLQKLFLIFSFFGPVYHQDIWILKSITYSWFGCLHNGKRSYGSARKPKTENRVWESGRDHLFG